MTGTTIGAAGGEVDAQTDQKIRAAAGGTSIEPRIRHSMEDAFGADFSSVRVHSGGESKQLNERIQAKAFTAGNHVWFRDGAPDTSSLSGQHLLAHELTHVVQQGGASTMRRRTATVRRDPLIIRRRDGDKKKGGTKDSDNLDLDAMKVKSAELDKRKLDLEQQIIAQQGKVAKGSVLAKIGAKSTLKKLEKQLAAVKLEIAGLTGQIKPLQEAKDLEDKRLADEAEAKRQAKVDSATHDYTALAKLRLANLVTYITDTPNWHENSKVSPAQRQLVDKVLPFASIAENQAPCASFTVESMATAATAASVTVDELLNDLSFYVAAAGERRDPFTVTAQKDPERAAEIGRGLKELLDGGLPRWVLAGAMEEDQLLALIDDGYIPSLITYFTYNAAPPTFQAEEGADFEAYLQMRNDDGVDPASFQGGPLSAYIRNFHRFEAAALTGLLANLADTSKKKPLTLILHSAIDHNGAFHRDPNMTAVITHTKNLTLMIEGGTSLAAYQSQIGPLARSHGNNDKIDQVMFAGHGGSRVIELAGGIEENTVDVDEHGTISQIDKPIDLNNDLAGAQAFFDEILANMDKAVVDKLAPSGPAQQQNRRILFNACLTNSNEVRKALSQDRKKARAEIKKYITDNASLATYMSTYAKSKGADVTSLGANASITQVELIDKPTGKLDLVAPSDPKVTASKLVYLEHGNEPHGVMLAAIEAWANQPVEAKKAMRRRAKKKSAGWDQAVIEGCFELGLMFADDDSFASDLQTLSAHAHLLSEMRHKEDCRVSKLSSVMSYWKADPTWQEALIGRLSTTTLFNAKKFTALVLAQVNAVDRSIAPAGALIVSDILPNFDAKTARDYVDVKYLHDKGLMATLMAPPATPGSITLALLGVLDGAKPASCVEHLRKLITPGAPKVPKLPAVDKVDEVPEGVGPRAEIPEVPEVKGRPKVDAIPHNKRAESPEVPDLPALPKMPKVDGPPPPTKAKGRKSEQPVAPKAPRRDGRPARDEAPEIPEVKPFFDPAHNIETLLAGRATEAAIAALVAP